MIITCPACNAQYLLPDDAVGPRGRRVKCTTCAHIWTQQAEAPPSDEDSAEQDFSAPTPARRRSAPMDFTAAPADAPRRDFILHILAFTGGMLLLTVICALAIRFSVVTWWPPAALAYETVGLPAPVPGAGLVLNDIKVSTDKPLEQGGLLSVAGKLENTNKKDAFLPVLRIRLNGENDLVLKEWNINLYGKTLPAKKSAGFEYSLQDAPADGQSVTLLFVD